MPTWKSAVQKMVTDQKVVDIEDIFDDLKERFSNCPTRPELRRFFYDLKFTPLNGTKYRRV